MAVSDGAENFRPLQWSKRHEQAAVLVADDRLTDEQIAEQIGISARMLYIWKAHPEFAAKVSEHVEKFAAVTLKRGIARRERRVEALNDRWKRMLRVIDERAEDPDISHVAGGTTGLIVHDVKGVGKGDDFQLIDIYGVDTGLLKELREHEKQAAQELGQWTEKQEHTGKDGAPLTFTISIDRKDDGDADSDA